MDTLLIEVPVPSMGATVTELTVIDIVTQPGATVSKGQKIAELESDKSVFEFEAPCDGTIQSIIVRAGDILPPGAPFLRIETADLSLKHLAIATGSASPAPKTNPPPDNTADDAATNATAAANTAAAANATAAAPVTAAAPTNAIATTAATANNNNTAAAATATATAAAAAASKPLAGPIPADSAPATPSPVFTASSAYSRPPMPVTRAGTTPLWTPRAIKIAREAGLDPAAITDIEATGPGGRVSGDDVTRHLATHAFTTPAAAPAPAATPADDGTVCIAGVGYAIPSGVRFNKEILKAFPDMTEAEIVKLTGIRERRYAAEGETATGLAVIAVRRAAGQSGIDLGEIDGVIMATLLPDQPVPAMASALARELGIPRALAFDLNAACAGWLYALEVGRAFIRSGTAKKLIVVTAELLSRITNPRDHATAFLFGDGAGAAILTDATGGHRLARMALSGDADQFAAIQRPGGGARRPVPNAAGNDRDDFFLQMNGAAVFKHAVIAFADLIADTLKRHDLAPSDIAWIVPHQANERILRAVSKRVGIPYERFVVTIGKYGNTSAASVSMALGWAAEEGIFNPGDKIIFCSVGAGMTFAGGLLVW